jgi:mono/diheme cytochrome c family protein
VRATRPDIPLLGALALSVLLAAALPAQAQDARRGRQLYETLCLTCHYEHVHDRAPARSKVHSLAELRKETALRAGLTGVRFTREDLEDVVAYLDQSHYHFAK